MNVLRASEMPGDPRKQISRIFTDGFYQWLKYFSKDKDKLACAFEHMFNLDVFYAAILDEDIVGIAALNDGKSQTVRLSKKELQKHLGFPRGFIAHKVLKHEFEDKKYPFEMKPKMASVEFVAAAQAHRGKGVASSIIEAFFTHPAFKEFVLEVADTNTGAVRLYEKLGFKEFMRVEMKNKKQSGVNYLVYMSCQKQ